MRFNFLILTLLSIIPSTFAAVDITSPEQGDQFSGTSGSASVQVQWKDDGSSDDALSLDNVEFYTLTLCTGLSGTIQPTKLVLKEQQFPSKTATLSVPQTDYANGYYFVQIYTSFKNGATTIQYTPRFRLTGMSGTAGTYIVTVTGDSPQGQTSGYDPATNTDFSSSFTVPYTLQTGKTRFAPMQMQPGSTVTATTWTRRFPTSAVTYYTTKQKSPVVMSTITPGWSYTASSEVNWASVAPYPTNWYAASERKVSHASITATKKKKRWLD
ncbi:KRE9 [Candida jiufengensis]|uniref:KRE9 n=1 Tax=Candida jiufengensis TaxID=497108 RepID=UPI0022249509|nr:KRE9 [Candida jiufengensis]KAI5952434.1 KRE9 [Candida jiufengensis]